MKIDRREFLKVSTALGGGFALEFSFPLAAMAAKGPPIRMRPSNVPCSTSRPRPSTTM